MLLEAEFPESCLSKATSLFLYSTVPFGILIFLFARKPFAVTALTKSPFKSPFWSKKTMPSPLCKASFESVFMKPSFSETTLPNTLPRLFVDFIFPVFSLLPSRLKIVKPLLKLFSTSGEKFKSTFP